VKGERYPPSIVATALGAAFHLSPVSPRPIALSPFRPFAVSQLAGCSLSGAMCCNFCSVAAGTHAAPSAPVILCGIIEKQVATFIRTLSNQRWVRVAKKIRRRFGERG
jgi:hypothetical protein